MLPLSNIYTHAAVTTAAATQRKKEREKARARERQSVVEGEKAKGKKKPVRYIGILQRAGEKLLISSDGYVYSSKLTKDSFPRFGLFCREHPIYLYIPIYIRAQTHIEIPTPLRVFIAGVYPAADAPVRSTSRAPNEPHTHTRITGLSRSTFREGEHLFRFLCAATTAALTVTGVACAWTRFGNFLLYSSVESDVHLRSDYSIHQCWARGRVL